MATPCDWQNFYNLSRQEFYELRKLDSDPNLQSMLVQKFTKANLHTFEGISWFSGFQDLLYAMAIYKLDVVATKCGNGDNIETINVFVVTISYFLIFSLNRYILEQYCASFVRYAHSSAAYPLVQTDLFHRIIFTLYSIGTFVMVMNTSLVEITSTKHQSSSYIGKCKFVPS